MGEELLELFLSSLFDAFPWCFVLDVDSFVRLLSLCYLFICASSTASGNLFPFSEIITVVKPFMIISEFVVIFWFGVCFLLYQVLLNLNLFRWDLIYNPGMSDVELWLDSIKAKYIRAKQSSSKLHVIKTDYITIRR